MHESVYIYSDSNTISVLHVMMLFFFYNRLVYELIKNYSNKYLGAYILLISCYLNTN